MGKGDPSDGQFEKIPLTFDDDHGVVGFEVFFEDPRRRAQIADASRPLLPDRVNLPIRDFQRHPMSVFSKPIESDTFERRDAGRKAHDKGQPHSPSTTTRSMEASDGFRDAESAGDVLCDQCALAAPKQVITNTFSTTVTTTFSQ